MHEFVAVAASFEDAGFEAAGAVGDLAFGDLGEQAQAELQVVLRLVRVVRPVHPGAEYILARAGKAELARLFIV